MSGTTTYYNGVLMRDCETIEYQSSIEYDEMQSNTKFIRNRVTVASTLISMHEGTGSGMDTLLTQHQSTIALPPIDDSTVPGRLEEILMRLAEPGKDFWYAVHSVNDQAPKLIDGQPALFEPVPDSGPIGYSYRLVLVSTGIIPTGSSSDRYVELFDNKLLVERKNVLDANSGPKPMNLDVKDIMGGRSVRVQVTFEICRVLSKPVNDEGDPGYDSQRCKGIICNTWKVVDSLGDDGAVSHTVTGKITVKDRRYKPNALRIAAFPLPFPYSRLTDRRYTTNESGLTLEYSHTFKHAGAAPPEGVRNFEASYAESVKVGMKGVSIGKMNITVWGWPHRTIDTPGVTVHTAESVQKQMLIRALHTILWSRIRGLVKLWVPLPGQEEKHCLLQEAVITEQVGKPRLDMAVSVLWSSKHIEEFAVRMNNLGLSIGDGIDSYDPRWWPVDNEWGRLPDEDSDNPNFENEIFPWAEEGFPEFSDYFTGYVHSPGSHRHTLPRVTGRTKNTTGDESVEWARAGGWVPDVDEEPEAPEEPEPEWISPNPASKDSLIIAVSRNLKGELVLGALPQVANESHSGIADVQASGFSYMQWDSEILSDTTEGTVTLPLSEPRGISPQRLTELINDSTYFMGINPTGLNPMGRESSISVRLHAPLTKRVVSVTATRINRPPEIPEPTKRIVRCKADSSNLQINCIETLERKELLSENAVLLADQCTREFTTSFRYTYGLSTPWAGGVDEGVQDDSIIPFGFDPTIKATAEENRILVKGGAVPIIDSAQTVYG